MEAALKSFLQQSGTNAGGEGDSQLRDSQTPENHHANPVETSSNSAEKATRLKVNASVISNQAIFLVSDDVELNQRVHAGDRLHILAQDKVVNRNRMTANRGIHIKTEEFLNDAGQVEIEGRIELNARRFFNRSRVFANDNPSNQYPVQRATFYSKGGWTLDFSECAENTGGEMITDGDGEFTTLFPTNQNLEHQHSGGYEERVKRHRLFGIGASTKGVWRTFCNTICDSAALIEPKGALTFDVRNDLVNEGVITAKSIKGRAQNLVNKTLSELGCAPLEPEERTGHRLATIHGDTDIDLEFADMAFNQGFIDAGNDLAIRAKQLKACQRLIKEKAPVVRQGGLFSSDEVRYETTTRLEGGGEFRAGNNNQAMIQETAQLTGARVTAGNEIDWSAKDAELYAQEDVQRADLPGRSSLLKSKNLHALHTKFHPCEFDAKGKAKVVARGHLVNEATRISGVEGAQLQGQTADHRVPCAINKIREDRGWTSSTDQFQAESVAPRILSEQGDASASTRHDHKFVGAVLAPRGVASIESDEGSVFLNSSVHTIPGRASRTKFNFFSITHTDADIRRDVAVPTVVFGENIQIRAKKEIQATGVQIQAIQTLQLKARKVRLDPCCASQHISVEGFKLGLSFSGFQILEALAKGLGPDDVLKAVLQSDPAIAAAFKFVEAKTSFAKAYRGLRLAIAQWELACARMSDLGRLDSLPTFLGKRAEILNEAGQFAPKIKLNIEVFSEDFSQTNVYLTQLSAGAQLIIQADWQELYGARLDAGESAKLTGVDGKTAEEIILQSAQSHLESSRDSVDVGFSIPTRSKGRGISDITFGTSDSAASSKVHHNSQLTTGHLEIDTRKATLAGANVHSETASGRIDNLQLQSQFDQDQSENFRASVSTSGDVSYSKGKRRETTIPLPTSFTVEQPSDLTIGILHLSGAISKNLQAREITHEDLTEFRSVRSIEFALNVKALLDAASGPVTQTSRKVPGIALVQEIMRADPLQQKAFKEMGGLEWEAQTEKRQLRATGINVANAPGLNSDIHQSRGPWQRKHSQGGVPLFLFDSDLWKQQAKALFGHPELEVQYQQSRVLSEQARDSAPERAEEDETAQLGLFQKILRVEGETESQSEQEGCPRVTAALFTDDSIFNDLGEDWKCLENTKKMLSYSRNHLRKLEITCSKSESIEQTDKISINSAQSQVNLAEMRYLRQYDQIIGKLYAKLNTLKLSECFTSDQLKSMNSSLRIEKEKIATRMRESQRGIQFVDFELQQIAQVMELERDRDEKKTAQIEELLFRVKQMRYLGKEILHRDDIFNDISATLKEPICDELYVLIAFEPSRFVELIRDCQTSKKGDLNGALKESRELSSPTTWTDLASGKTLPKLIGKIPTEELESKLLLWSSGKENTVQDSLMNSYALVAKQDPILGDLLQPLPQWNVEAQQLCGQLLADASKTEHEKMDVIRAFVVKNVEQEVLKRHKSLENFESNQTTFESTYLRICHNFVKDENFYYQQPKALVGGHILWNDLESMRAFPSRICYYGKGMSAAEAKASHLIAQDIQVLFTGGLFNYQPSEYDNIADVLSTAHGNRAVQIAFNSRVKGRRTGFSECLDGLQSLFSNEFTLAIVQLAYAIRSNLANNKEGVLHVVAHSHGGIILDRALELLKKEEVKRLWISTFGSGKMISKLRCENTHNYLNKWDLVGQSSKIATLHKSKDFNIHILEPKANEGCHEQHSKTNETYLNKIKEIAHYIETRYKDLYITQKNAIEWLLEATCSGHGEIV